ncbi:MAG: hypothetical protein FWH52_00165 [Synergistaceae bacterium]|nr:hypothetical protein [Synergistaceae bacterium]
MIRILNKHLDRSIYTPIIPTKIWSHIKSNETIHVVKACFPGYVFIRTEKSADEVLKEVIPIISFTKDAWFFLSYGSDRYNMALKEAEQILLQRLMNSEFCMDISRGFIEGDRVKIIAGALFGLESRIKKINKRRQTAVISIPIMGDTRDITLALEIINKVSQD